MLQRCNMEKGNNITLRMRDHIIPVKQTAKCFGLIFDTLTGKLILLILTQNVKML